MVVNRRSSSYKTSTEVSVDAALAGSTVYGQSFISSLAFRSGEIKSVFVQMPWDSLYSISRRFVPKREAKEGEHCRSRRSHVQCNYVERKS